MRMTNHLIAVSRQQALHNPDVGTFDVGLALWLQHVRHPKLSVCGTTKEAVFFNKGVARLG